MSRIEAGFILVDADYIGACMHSFESAPIAYRGGHRLAVGFKKQAYFNRQARLDQEKTRGLSRHIWWALRSRDASPRPGASSMRIGRQA